MGVRCMYEWRDMLWRCFYSSLLLLVPASEKKAGEEEESTKRESERAREKVSLSFSLLLSSADALTAK